MWGDSIDHGDVTQGYSGNCWLLSSASTLASTPQRIRDIFEQDELNKQGVYNV